MITMLSAVVSVLTCFSVFFMMRKYWWAPIFGLVHETAWAALFILAPDQKPMLIAVAVYSVVFATAIPKWYRERHRPAEIKP